MTIFIDSSEIRPQSTMPEIPGAVMSDYLEEWSGADFMVSPLEIPLTTEPLLRKHIEAGALLVQRKHGLDLVSSMGERLNTSLARMQKLGACQSQCVLLFIGVLTCDSQDQAIIDSRETGQRFWSVQAAISKWHDRGGVYESLSRYTLIPEWCRMKLRHLNQYESAPTKQVFQTESPVQVVHEFLQTLVPVNDGRNTLVTLPGIGPITAELLWDEFGNLSDILCWLTMPPSKTKQKIKGVGPKTIENVREYLDILPVLWLQPELMPEEFWPEPLKQAVAPNDSITIYDHVADLIENVGLKSPAEFSTYLTENGHPTTPQEVAQAMLQWREKNVEHN